MNTVPKKPRLERRRLSVLVPFPDQDRYFGDQSEIEVLPDHDPEQDHYLDPPHILPDNQASLPPNTILRGSQDLQAVRHDGTAEIDVLVRYDLAQADRETVERVFLMENQAQVKSPITKARIALRLFELEKQRPKLAHRAGSWIGELRDRVGNVLEMSGRNLHRYVNLLLYTPQEVQNAVRDRKISLVVAERVTWLGQAEKDRISQRILRGEDPKAVVAEHIGSARGRSAGDPVTLMNRGLSRALRHIEQPIDDLRPSRLRNILPNLLHAQKVLSDLIERAKG